MSRITRTLGLSLLCAGLLMTSGVAGARGPMEAAACKRDITPVVGVNHSEPIFLAGFSTNRLATGVHDPLWARGVVIRSRGKKIAIVTLDVVGYFHNEVQTIRSLVRDERRFDSIIVTSTHNHEGPDTLGLWGPDDLTTGVDLDYLNWVNDRVVECIEEADANLAPARIKFATGSTVGQSLEPWPDLVADGRVLQELEIDLTLVGGEGILHVEGDAGPVTNPSLPTFQLRRFDRKADPQLGEIIATVVNFASHPESLGSNNTLITSDFPHFMREVLEARYGGVAIYLSADLGVLQGPLDVFVADENGDPVLPRRSFVFAERMGELLAESAMGALDSVDDWLAKPRIQVRRVSPITVDVENPFFRLLGDLGVFGRRPFVGDTLAATITTEAQVIRIGPANLVVTPNELDPQIANLYRDRMTRAEHRFVLGLGNDEIGYQMPASKFNPSCFLCVIPVLLGDPESCPLLDTLDCDTVFINNIGPAADGLLRGHIEGMIDDLN